MAVDSERSAKIGKDGLSFQGGVHFSSATAVPTHQAPEGSRYWRVGTVDVYRQDGPGDAANWSIESGVSSATYAHLFQTDESTIDVVTQDVWVKWDNTTLGPEAGDASGSTTNDNITIDAGGAGDYEIVHTARIQAPTNNNIQAALFVNDVLVPQSISEVDIDNTSSIYTVGFSCLMTLAVDDVVDLRFRNTSGTPDITIFNVCLYATKLIGGSTGATGSQGPAGETNVDGGDASTTLPAIDIDGGSA